MGTAWRAGVSASRTGAAQDVPISHARLNVESMESALRMDVCVMLDGWVQTVAKYVQQVSMAMTAIKHVHAHTEAHVILFTDGAPVLLVSMEISVRKNALLDSTG